MRAPSLSHPAWGEERNAHDHSWSTPLRGRSWDPFEIRPSTRRVKSFTGKGRNLLRVWSRRKRSPTAEGEGVWMQHGRYKGAESTNPIGIKRARNRQKGL